MGAYAGEEYSFGYDANGNVTRVTDPLANVTDYAFDSLNRLIGQTDAALGVASLAWDSSDNLDSATDQRSLSTTLVHNGFGDVIGYASPDSGTETYIYDAAGNMTRRTDARGVVTDWTYDLLGRPTAMRFPAAPAEDVTYAYDDATPGHYGIGRLAGYADESGTTAYRYDARGNIVREDRAIGTQSYVSEYGWNADGLLIRKTYPSGRIVDYARNTRGQVTSVSGDGPPHHDHHYKRRQFAALVLPERVGKFPSTRYCQPTRASVRMARGSVQTAGHDTDNANSGGTGHERDTTDRGLRPVLHLCASRRYRGRRAVGL